MQRFQMSGAISADEWKLNKTTYGWLVELLSSYIFKKVLDEWEGHKI